jgi:hypothetical protein
MNFEQGEGVGFERHIEMGFRLHEALDEELGVALEAEDFKLDGVHQGVEQATLGERLVEDHDVDKGQGVHVGDFGEIVESESAGLGIESRWGEALAVEFDDADLVERRRRKIGPHASLVLVAERAGGGEMLLALLAQVGGNILDGLCDLGRGQLELGVHLHRGQAVFGILVGTHGETYSGIKKLEHHRRGPNTGYLYSVMCTL